MLGGSPLVVPVLAKRLSALCLTLIFTSRGNYSSALNRSAARSAPMR